MNMINSFTDEMFFLSNFYPCKIEYEGIVYKNTEAAFQAQKCVAKEDRHSFSNLNPTEAKNLGRIVNLRKDLEDIKIKEMARIIHEKFKQNPDLADKLLLTGDSYLEEGNTWGDRVWGTVNGKGANNLGRILMNEREKIKERQNESDYDFEK